MYFTGLNSIGSSAFSGCSGLTSVTIPNSVTSIGRNAFYECSGLTNVSIGNSVTSIGSSAFYKCSGLTSITIGNSVTSIGSYAFSGCSGLTSVTIPNSVTSIGSSAFSGCSGLTEIIIPNSVTDIGDSAFKGCSGLTSVTIGNSVFDIGESAFEGCTSLARVNISDITEWLRISFHDGNANPLSNAHHLYVNGTEITELTIPNSVWKIDNFAFYGYSALTSINIPNSVKEIGYWAFSGCSGLTSVNIPNSVTEIGRYVFSGCTELMCITVASDNEDYDSRNNCNAIISKDDYEDENRLIAGCKSTIIPYSVSIIEEGAFYNITSLTSIVIPPGVTCIDNAAFANCSELTSVTCLATTPPGIDSDTFYGIPDNATLYVPSDTRNNYIIEPCWKRFSKIIELEVIAKSISLNETSVVIGNNGMIQLTASIQPSNITKNEVIWSSSNSNIARVSATGLVTAIVPGTVTITAMTTDGSYLSSSCLVTVSDNYMSMTDISASQGDIIVMAVKMFNTASISSFQTDIFLPVGLELLKEDGEYIIDPSERMTRTHSIMSSDVASGAIRVLCYSSNNKPFTGESGDELFYITVKVADDAEGDYRIELKNTLLTNTDFVDLPTPDVAAHVNVYFLQGDANNNGAVTVGDVVATAQYVLEQNPQPFNFEAADVNEDNYITVADVARIAWMVLNPTAYAPMRAPALWCNGDRMSGESISLMPGETRRVSIMLDNEMDYSAFQLDLNLPEGLMASNFNLTDRAGSHAFDVNTLKSGSVRALCYSPALTTISGHEGTLLTFDVTATGTVFGDITVDGIEMVTTDCQSVRLDGFAISVNNTTAVNELANGKTVARVDYFNLAGQQVDSPESGVTLVVTTYTDGTRTTSKVFK